MPHAVIFDCDGVLVDAEPIHAAAWRSLAEEWLEQPPPDHALRGLAGRRAVDAWPDFLAAHFPHREFNEAQRDRAQHHFKAARETPIRAFPGALELARALHARGAPVAVVSAQLLDTLLFHLHETGLLDEFPVCVGGDEVAAGPPDPALLREAAARLDVAPGGCVIVEDTPVGIQAAHAAGMRVIAVATTFPEPELRDAHRVVRALAELTVADVLAP